jgi:DNA-binding NtrC family response regulator
VQTQAPAQDEPRSAEPLTSYADAMAQFEKGFLSDALRASGGRVTEAAQRIGIGRATLYKKIVALGIEV